MNRVENIVDLPNEIILSIFEYLLPSDRRVASECCRKFLDIWLHKKFIGDRRLVIGEASDLSSIEALERTQRKYEHIVLSECSKYFAHKVHAEFWTKLGETVTTLELVGTAGCPNKDFWKLFPKLKVLKVSDCLPTHIDQLPKGLELISVVGYGKKQLKRLYVEYLRGKLEPVNIELKNCELNEVAAFVKHVRQHSPHKIVTIDSGKEPHLYSLFKAPHVEHLSVLLVNPSFLDNFEENFPQLQHLELALAIGLPLRNWTFLKKLTICPKNPKEINLLGKFENLEELEFISYDESGCFFTHDPFLNQNLKTLTCKYYMIEPTPCLKCFETMTKTFPNIENLTLYLTIKNEHLKALQANVTTLKSLNINTPGRSADLTFVGEDFPNLTELRLNFVNVDVKHWPLMPSLRKASLQLNEEDLNVFEKTPTLEHLELNVVDRDIGDMEKHPEIIEEALKPLKRLRYFKLKGHCQSEDCLEKKFECNERKRLKYLKHATISLCSAENEPEESLPKPKIPYLGLGCTLAAMALALYHAF